jgi:hypothetical protein
VGLAAIVELDGMQARGQVDFGAPNTFLLLARSIDFRFSRKGFLESDSDLEKPCFGKSKRPT